MESVDLMASLEQCDLFRDLEHEDLRLLLHYGKLRMFRAGEIIYKKDEQALGRFCLVLSGRVGIVTAAGQLIKEIEGREILGEIGVVRADNKRTATVKAIKSTEIFEWNVELIGVQVPGLVERLKALAWKNVSSYYV